jgi:hypothetical protein
LSAPTSTFRLSAWPLSYSLRSLTSPNTGPGHLPSSNSSLPQSTELIRPVCSLLAHEGGSLVPNSSLEVSSPSALSSRSNRWTRTFVSVRSDLPQSLRSALAVSHDLDGFIRFDPSRGLPRISLLGFLPSRLSRFAEDAVISDLAFPLDLPRICSRLHGDELPHLASAPGLQGFTPATRPSPPTSGFPSAGARHPLGFLLSGTSLPWWRPDRSLLASRAVRPRHLSRIEKEHALNLRASLKEGRSSYQFKV